MNLYRKTIELLRQFLEAEDNINMVEWEGNLLVTIQVT